MEEPLTDHTNHHARRHKRVWSFKKISVALVVSALLFSAGVITGRGNVLGKPAKTTAASTSLDYSSVDQVYSILKKDFDGTLDTTTLTDGLKSGLVSASGDPYTVYFNPKQAKDFNNQLAGTIIGIGAELGTDSDNNIVIVSPLSGYPAEKAGLKPKDIVAGVDGKATTGMRVDQVVQKIRGTEGTEVKLTIVRNSGSPFTISVTRQKITVPSVKWEENGNIGYLKISQFTDDTYDLAQKAAQEFKNKNVKAVVLDLRGDPGGYLTSAVNVSSLWLDQGKTVVSERRGSTIISNQVATGNNPLKGLPTVVIIDGGSASASEITAGALKDNGVATVIGQKSFGKGSVQQVENLLDGSELKVTVARWYRPNGKNIDKQGIAPDTLVSITDADTQAGKDPQKDAAFQYLQQKISS